jgi:hypothetical protein
MFSLIFYNCQSWILQRKRNHLNNDPKTNQSHCFFQEGYFKTVTIVVWYSGILFQSSSGWKDIWQKIVNGNRESIKTVSLYKGVPKKKTPQPF